MNKKRIHRLWKQEGLRVLTVLRLTTFRKIAMSTRHRGWMLPGGQSPPVAGAAVARVAGLTY